MSEWKSLSMLRKIDTDISEFGYGKDFVTNEKNYEKMEAIGINMQTGRTCLAEPLEVKEEKGMVLWRANNARYNREVPKFFMTQYGRFCNHYHGEFPSWIDFSESDNDGAKEFSVEGRFVDMFDCGEYCMGISCLRSSFYFSVIRIDKEFNIFTVYDNLEESKLFRLEYMGRFRYNQGHALIASGFAMPTSKSQNTEFITRLLFIEPGGNCTALKEWPFQISHANSITASGDYVYFGQNKMITRLNIESGEMESYTNKEPNETENLRELHEG